MPIRENPDPRQRAARVAGAGATRRGGNRSTRAASAAARNGEGRQPRFGAHHLRGRRPRARSRGHERAIERSHHVDYQWSDHHPNQPTEHDRRPFRDHRHDCCAADGGAGEHRGGQHDSQHDWVCPRFQYRHHPGGRDDDCRTDDDHSVVVVVVHDHDQPGSDHDDDHDASPDDDDDGRSNDYDGCSDHDHDGRADDLRRLHHRPGVAVTAGVFRKDPAG